MRYLKLARDSSHRRFAGLALAFLVGVVGCAAPPAKAQVEGAAPDLSISAARYADEDAIIFRWEQHWALDKDGTVHRRDRQWMKLLNTRPIRDYADPRIDFV
ncbi:MAG: hypothetical protein KJ749_04400, partial [Planctomycetes bacterium]|nr:hypothetical protein [Planctomycetota bacterium]